MLEERQRRAKAHGASAAGVSVALGARGSTRIVTLPALTIDELLSALT